MSYELQPTTDAGKQFVSATESIMAQLRGRAADADKNSQINRDNFADMQAAGITGAFVPQACGGFGLNSIHDWMTGMTRLGRGDASTAIALNMHLGVSRGLASGWQSATAAKNDAAVNHLEEQFRQICTGEMYICATATEPGTDNLHPLTEAVRTEGGWQINGLKIFVTGSPVASHLAMNLRVPQDNAIGSVILPFTTDGIKPQNDWQAMGMRASGSQSVIFDNVWVADHMVRPMATWGQWSVNMLMNRNLANLPMLGVFVGIAEHAMELALASTKTAAKATKQPKAQIPGIQHMIGEMEITLATARAMLSQMGQMADAFIEAHQGQEIALSAAHELLRDHQSMKWIVNKNSIEVVNRAMDIVGGSAFMDKHPLSRLYRDVRAGPFMQPFSPSEAREYIGKVTLGEYPEN